MSPEAGEKFMNDVNTCKTQSGATDVDVKDLYEHSLPTTKPAKCLNACVMMKLGVVS